MYDIDTHVGKVSTVKLTNGVELVCQILAVNKKEKILTVGNPKVVVINGEQLALIPYSFTGLTEQVFLPLSSVHTVLETYKESAEDYEKLLVKPDDNDDK